MPMDEEYWNLDQALAWVVWRSPDIVETLQTVSDFSSATYFSDFVTPYDDGKRKKYAETRQLLTLLRSGHIVAYGYYGEDIKNREKIPAPTWMGLEFKTIMRKPAFANPTGKNGLRWNDILIKKAKVETFFASGDENITSPIEQPQRKLSHVLRKPKQKRVNELHEEIRRTILSLGFPEKNIPANDVWKHLKANFEHDDDSCIKSVEGNIIEWQSYRGISKPMQRTTFNNVVSKIKKNHG
ncbi:MAG: hypothetical protein ACRBCT_01290 [Alphaproteobacteria bacterium]